MADYRAVKVACEAVIHLLRTSYRPEDFGNHHLEFKVYLPGNFAQHMDAGVSLFLYRIYHNGSHRTPNGRTSADGRRYRTKLPVDLHCLLTAWGADATLQHTIAGWMMRTLEDGPVIPASFLNAIEPDVFSAPDEALEVCLTELTTEDLFRIWETITDKMYQLSVPYVIRNVRIESSEEITHGEKIQRREFDYAVNASGSER